VTATPDALPETPKTLDPVDEPSIPSEPNDGPPLPLLASEPWLTAPVAAVNDLRVLPEAVPPGLFDFPDEPAAPGQPRRRGHRIGQGTTKTPPIPKVTIQPVPEPVETGEPLPQKEPGELPDSLISGLKKSGHLAVSAPRLLLSGALVQQIRNQIAEHRVYPDAAIDLGIEGSVKTRFRLDATGNIHSFEILNEDEVDPLLAEGARRTIEAGAPYPVPETTTRGSLYLAVACWTDGAGAVKRMRMVESTGRDLIDSSARARARTICADKTRGWHVVEFEHGFSILVRADGDQFVPSLVMGKDLPKTWAKAIRAELADLIPPIATTSTVRIPITFRLTW
jgi:outer membrane biosynthesis protein TonB